MSDLYSDLFGNPNKNRSEYSIDEINDAKKRQSKYGGTFMENLAAVHEQTKKTQKDREKASLNSINADIDKMKASIKSDFTSVNNGVVEKPKKKAPEDAISKFNGLTDEIEKEVFGQHDFIKKLVIAFKRPFVMTDENGGARNSIFITGADDTGKRYALKKLCVEMNKRGLLNSNAIRVVDLSLYSNASDDKLLIQDLYAALSSEAEVVLFENYNECHPSLLPKLADLVIKGKCMLSERYVMHKGQLVNVSNALASDTVNALSAEGKYLVIVSETPVDKLADAMGAPFVNALGDICQTTSLDEEALKKVAERETNELKEAASKQLSFELTVDEEFEKYAVETACGKKGLGVILGIYDDVTKCMAELRLENDYKLHAPCTLSAENGVVILTIDEEKIDLFKLLPGQYSGELEAVRKEMDNIVGLKQIKEYILSLEEYFSVQKKRRDAGLKAGEVNKHMIFTGNPGTGKTTIARIVSRYLKAIGVLTGGQLVEVSRADLVGRYVGHTAPLTNQVIQSAIGGVLFIDEAYSLYRGKDDTFGLEAIDTLVKGIEDNRDNLIVILAGYSDEMEEFLTANSGLKSRFPNIVNFPDYTGSELLAIAHITAKSKGYSIDEGAENALLTYFNAVQIVRARDAGNGRLVRNKIEAAILNQSHRLVAEPDADLSLLTSMDFDLEDVNG